MALFHVKLGQAVLSRGFSGTVVDLDKYKVGT